MRLSTRFLAIVSSLSYMNTAQRVRVKCDVIFLGDNLARVTVTGIEFFFVVNDLSGK